jgi:ribosomal protein S18 acetylase RimI-like enzyme
MPHDSRDLVWPFDAAAVARFLGETWTALGPNLSLHPGDFWWRANLREGRGFRVFEDRSGSTIGLVEYDVRDASADMAVHPDHPELEGALVDWVETELARRTDAKTICLGGFEGNAKRHALLTSKGYERSSSFYWHFHRSLATPIPRPDLPPGHLVRSLEHASDYDARIELGGIAFGATLLTPEIYGRMAKGPGYREDLDLVVEAPDGNIAAFGMCWADPVTRVGEFEPIGAHPAHRRKGLARSLMLEGLRRLRDEGMVAAIVYTGGRNTAARALYEGIGFGVTGLDYDYRKPLARSVR